MLILMGMNYLCRKSSMDYISWAISAQLVPEQFHQVLRSGVRKMILDLL